MQKQVPFIIIIVVLVLSAFVITRLHISNDIPSQVAETTQQASVPMFSKAPDYLNKEQKDQLAKEVSDLFMNSDEIIFRYRESNSMELKSITIDDRSALKLFSENFNFDSDVSYGRGYPMSPAFMYFLFKPSDRSLVFDIHIAQRNIRVFDPEQTMNYYGTVSHDFLLFSQYYFEEIIDRYGEFNMVDKTRLYTYHRGQNAYINEKLTDFSSIISPYHVTDDH